MHDDDDIEVTLEWYDCRECESPYTWFRIVVMEGVEMYGWVHLIQLWGRPDRCSRDKEMVISDMRFSTGKPG